VKETPARKTARQIAATAPAKQDSTYVKMAIATVLVILVTRAMKAQLPVQLIVQATTTYAPETRSANSTDRSLTPEMKADSSTVKKTAVQHHVKQMTIALPTAISRAFQEHAAYQKASVISTK